ncbi:hypothetical protein OIDMADRAFT_23794 [Oidiodendron maius Zn]|uniref:SMP domain-containing protein n=1 Tax=Oidiodendron maius (strain Zn) TaxID=913774 RepID=A0A0C3I1Z4_OIDMZ|nr:hypothetical protein OIDMADRAFT_23794 [Oidiodendron maius Zn]
MKISIAGSVVSLLIAGVVSLPMPPKEHIDANIDPSKAPATAQNIQDHVAKYGPDSMTTTVGQLNSPGTASGLRTDAIGDKKQPGMVIDEEPPASFRNPGDPVTTKATAKEEGSHQGGVLSSGIQKAKASGNPDTTITHGIKGQDLGPSTSTEEPNPAQAAKDRHS